MPHHTHPAFLRRPALAALSLVLLAAVLHAGDVVVVDPGGGNGKDVLQSAIDGALDGDVLLLRDGSYNTPAGPISIVGKGITILADAHVAPPQLEAVLVRDLPAGRTLTLRGLAIAASPSGPDLPARLDVADCDGLVWIEDCTIAAGPGGAMPANGQVWPGRAAASFTDAGAVALERCQLTGGDGHAFEPGEGPNVLWASSGGPAALALRSRLALHDCTLHGGRGGDGPAFILFPGAGGRGLDAVQCELIAAGSSLLGGDEGDDNDTGTPAKSGHGLYMVQPAVAPWLRDTLLAPGAASGAGIVGLPMFPPAGSSVVLPAAARSLAVDSPAREGEVFRLHARGLPGDLVSVLIAPQGGWAAMLPGQGALLVPTSGLIGPVALHVITALDGQLDLPLVAPHLPPALGEGSTVLLQGVFAGRDDVTLGGATALAWIAAGI